MASTRLLLIGVLAAAAVGVSVKDKVRFPWQDSGASGRKPPTVQTLGYLSPAELPDSTILAPPPPQRTSAEMQRDEEARTLALVPLGTARYRQARTDTALPTADTAKTFACALGVEISKERTPRLYGLLAKMVLDIRASTYRAKDLYKRPRPFVAHNTRSCLPDSEPMLRDDGSYPSGQAGIGWAYASVLGDLVPERRQALLARAAAYGRSRMICEINWDSDLDAGRRIGKAVVAKAMSKEAFRADLDAARTEVAAASASRTAPSVDCQMETLALASR